MTIFGPLKELIAKRKPPIARPCMVRMVADCLASALAIERNQPRRWPLDRWASAPSTTVPAAMLHPAEVVGSYVKLQQNVIASSGVTLETGSVLPVVACDKINKTYTLQLAEGRPGTRLSGVPVHVLAVVLGLKWEEKTDG